MDHEELLREFLLTPLDCGDKLFQRFSELPGAIYSTGENTLQRFVYIPGRRKDRVLLTAHIDTVWDAHYNKPHLGAPDLAFDNGVFHGNDCDCGIGADDRAGCAMLWALKDCGHSLLILDGEEKGKFGAKYLKETRKDLFKEINRHCFMIALDWAGTCTCLYNQVDITKKFQRYISSSLRFFDSKMKGGCDLAVLCHRVCGVNIGVGYHRYHSNNERLMLFEWENTLNLLSAFLNQKQKRFPIHIKHYFLKCKSKLFAFLSPIKKKIFRNNKKELPK